MLTENQTERRHFVLGLIVCLEVQMKYGVRDTPTVPRAGGEHFTSVRSSLPRILSRVSSKDKMRV